MFDFMAIGIIDILDIVIVALLIFLAFKWMRGSSAINIFFVVVSFYILRVVASSLGMKMMTALMDMVLNLGFLALVVIFQPEIRRFLINFGKQYRNVPKGAFLGKFSRKERRATGEIIQEICEACRTMSAGKVGALIVLAPNEYLDEVVQTGDEINAKVNRRLLCNLFFKNSPLHDGAVIIDSQNIVAARCTLPITQRTDIPPQYGMRHKAAIGITEQADVDVVVISEENGNISYVNNGILKPINNINELRLALDKSYNGELG